jgi:beta-phosphoglucomutase-like phosphatase (HAD superfamily)
MEDNMNMIKGCIFDLDGVLVDTAKYHYLAWKRLAQELGFFFSEKDNERLKGVSRMASLEILLQLHFDRAAWICSYSSGYSNISGILIKNVKRHFMAKCLLL